MLILGCMFCFSRCDKELCMIWKFLKFIIDGIDMHVEKERILNRLQKLPDHAQLLVTARGPTATFSSGAYCFNRVLNPSSCSMREYAYVSRSLRVANIDGIDMHVEKERILNRLQKLPDHAQLLVTAREAVCVCLEILTGG
jgi:hypothetical protein